MKDNSTMKKFLFFFAVTGWICALTAHLFALADIDVADTISCIWILQIGIFIVWFPAIRELKNRNELTEYKQMSMSKKKEQIKLFKIIFKGAPLWLVAIAVTGLLYAFVNFIFFMISQSGTPSIENGKYVLENHGRFLKAITEQEYYHCKAILIRGSSGHWIAFYGVAAAILFPFKIKSASPSTVL